MNYLIIKRPYFVTSTGEVQFKPGYFVYSSTYGKFTPFSLLLDIFDDPKNILYEGTILEQNILPDMKRLEKISKKVQSFIDKKLSAEESIISTFLEETVDDLELEIIERKFLK